MAENVTLARPYAEATFRLARDGKMLPAWRDALARMALIATDARMHATIGNPKLGPAQLVNLFVDLTGKASDEMKNFVHVLVENERLTVLPEIHALFVELMNEHEGVKEAHIRSAFALDETAVQKLVAELEPRFNWKLRADVTVDPELIGGVKIAIGDEVIDASVRGKLATMATALKN
jgi:F-type H+-transporting ATPase subunit delta